MEIMEMEMLVETGIKVAATLIAEVRAVVLCMIDSRMYETE